MTAESGVYRDVPSRLLSGKKGTRLVLRRDADGLEPGMVVRTGSDLLVVSGRIHRTGDVVLAPRAPGGV